MYLLLGQGNIDDVLLGNIPTTPTADYHAPTNGRVIGVYQITHTNFLPRTRRHQPDEESDDQLHWSWSNRDPNHPQLIHILFNGERPEIYDPLKRIGISPADALRTLQQKDTRRFEALALDRHHFMEELKGSPEEEAIRLRLEYLTEHESLYDLVVASMQPFGLTRHEWVVLKGFPHRRETDNV